MAMEQCSTVGVNSTATVPLPSSQSTCSSLTCASGDRARMAWAGPSDPASYSGSCQQLWSHVEPWGWAVPPGCGLPGSASGVQG